MKSKTLIYLFGTLALSGMLASCSTSTKVASSFGTRKYTKGFFNNSPSSVATVASHLSVPVSKVTAQATNAVNENSQPSVTGTVASPSPSTTANVASVNTESQQMFPSAKAKKSKMSSLLAVAKTRAIAQASGSKALYGVEKAAGVETVTQAQRGGGGNSWFDFKDHPVRTVLVILLCVVIIALLIFAAANGALTVSAGA